MKRYSVLLVAGLTVLSVGLAGTAGASLLTTDVRADHDGQFSPTVDFLEPVGESIPTDLDGDGQYEDVNGNGKAELGDVVTLFVHRNDRVVQHYPDRYDFDGTGEVTLADVVALFGWVTGGAADSHDPAADFTVAYADTGETIDYDETIQPNRTLVLDGSPTHDPAGRNLSYEWSLDNDEFENGSTAEIGPLESGTYRISLSVVAPGQGTRDIAGRDLFVGGDIEQDVRPATALNGSGTAADPYEVATFRDLRLVNRNHSAHYELVDDVDASASTDLYYADVASNDHHRGFDPIGDEDEPFTGHFDGNGHVISNVYIDRLEANRQGVFGAVGEAGTVERVGVRNVTITMSDTGRANPGFVAAGGLVGHNAGTVRQSFASAGIDNTVRGVGPDPVGGLVGWNTGTVSDSYVDLETDDPSAAISGQSPLGGLIGYNRGLIERSYGVGSIVVSQPGGYGGSSSEGYRLTGSLQGNVTDSYYGFTRGPDGDYPDIDGPYNRDVENVTGETAASTLEGFDFEDTWRTTEEYPELAWEANATAGDAR